MNRIVDPFYRMNSGVIYLFDVMDGKSAGLKPLKPLAGVGRLHYEELSVSAEDYTLAMQDDEKLEMRIRVLRNARITVKNVARIKQVYFGIWRVKHGVNRHGVLITDVWLKTVLDKYEVTL